MKMYYIREVGTLTRQYLEMFPVAGVMGPPLHRGWIYDKR